MSIKENVLNLEAYQKAVQIHSNRTIRVKKGNKISLSQYKGKVLLIVNTATGCGFTTQYSELQDLYEKFNEKGFEILDFPCNQFGNQAPGNNEEIHTFCTGRFGITFPQFAKIDVNGEQAIPLYKWLTENSSFKGFGHSPMGLMLSGAVKLTDKNYKKNNKRRQKSGTRCETGYTNKCCFPVP